MKGQNEKDKNVELENVGAVHTHTHTHTHTSSLKKNKKSVLISGGILVGIMFLLGIFALIFSMNNKKNESLGSGNEEYNAGEIINGDKGYISSAQIIQTKTGTGPWDADDEPGNDSSENNNIVRSFDQVTWTLDLTMALKNGVAESTLTGGTIEFEASLPENCANVMEWNLDSMQWIEGANLSEDGITLKGKYKMSETDISIPGKQSLVLVLKILGAENGLEIKPTFSLKLLGNEENESCQVTGSAIKVSASPRYNIKLTNNTNCNSRVTVDYGEGETEGKMYGYSAILQLYNDNSAKGLKGIEYPKGEMNFNINLNFLRSEFNSSNLTDITNECTPILWNYKVNNKEPNGNIQDRNMIWGNAYSSYGAWSSPYGKLEYGNEINSVYNSGNVYMEQQGSKISVNISDYEFNDIFPQYNSEANPGDAIVYGDNVGCFSVIYFQIFVPNNEASTVENRNYYLTVSDSNFEATSKSDVNTSTQVITSDDSLRTSHVLYKRGNYTLDLLLKDFSNKTISTDWTTGDATAKRGEEFLIDALFQLDPINDVDDKVYAIDAFIKFDGEAFEPSTTETYINQNKQNLLETYGIGNFPAGMKSYTDKITLEKFCYDYIKNNIGIDIYDYSIDGVLIIDSVKDFYIREFGEDINNIYIDPSKYSKDATGKEVVDDVNREILKKYDYTYYINLMNSAGESDEKMKFGLKFVTKKDGKNWTSQDEMNKTRIQDLVKYDKLEDIPEGYICVGMFFESTEGYLKTPLNWSTNHMFIPLKIKDGAEIGKTYGITHDARYWNTQLDRNIYTQEKLNSYSSYPTPAFNSENQYYIKTEYDKNGKIIAGTNSGGQHYGNTVLVIGADQSIQKASIDETTQEKKINYDFSKNEYDVLFKLTPQLIKNNWKKNDDITGVNLKIEDTLPEGLTYIPGSSNRGEPDEIVKNSDGSSTLVWYIYNCTVGKEIEAITYKAHIDEEAKNGEQFESKVVISEVIGDDGVSKIGNSEISNRTTTSTINVTNMATHRLYKEVNSQIIEQNGDITYRIVYQNKTNEVVSNFQLLDVLPYNEDGRGTSFNGTYTLKDVKVTQTRNNTVQSNENLSLYVTNSENVKGMEATNSGIGMESIWQKKEIGQEINQQNLGIALKGQVQGNTTIEVVVTLNTSGNVEKDKYVNNATAQVYSNSEAIVSQNVENRVVYRELKGKVWEDTNKNGIIDNNEAGIKGITVKLTNTTTNQEVGSTTTNEQGEYNFIELDRAKYKVKVEYGDKYYLTEKEVGDNIEINSKFNTTTKETDEITKLDSILSPEIVEENVNAGLIKITYNITTKVEGTGGNISGEGEAVYESVDKGGTNTKDIVVSPNKGYRVDTIKVNGSPIEFTEEANHSVILSKFTNMQENKEVVVTFKKIKTSVLVHHYKENTTEQLSKDVTINGEVGDDYTTQVATDIPQNYELVETPAYASGKMTEDQIVVIYYYRLKTPSVTNNITKTGTDRITVANQEMSYTVTYTANVTDYIGNAELTIVDTLAYAIDEGKSDLAGGTYDSASKTITWKENVSDIDSYNGKGTVNITKTFRVVYVGLDMNQEKVKNNVKGHIKLLTPEKTSEEVTGSQESTIYKAIISSEKLVDKTEATEGEKVTYTIRIKNDGNLAKTVTVRDTLPAGITFDNDTLIQVGDTGTVYTEQNLKNGIPVEVPAYGSIDVVFAGKVDTLANNEYSKTLTNQATVDNEPTNEVKTEVTKANITAHKESDPSSGNKVREGDEITYRIKVRNDGTRAGDVIVKDTIPTGTTFVEGSIKIDNVVDSSKTATDLQNGITLNVPISTEKVVEFKVRVNKQIDGIKIKNTAYINQNGEDKKVPEEPEHTYVEPKEEQSISKNGTTTIERLDQEITYNINYTAKITDYRGKAIVKLVDTLPYAIDEGKSDLAGGTYDEASKTITWEETVDNIQLTEEKEVTINKTIKVVYTGINQGTTSVKNVVTGHIEYETPVMTSDEVTANSTTTTGFTVNIPVSKVWEDDTDRLGQRPTKVVFKLHGSDGSEYTKEISKPGTQGSTTTQDSTNPNKWNDIFENLPKYDSNNQEIVYTITEEEKTEGDLKYYDNVVTDKTVTNTNKYGKVIVHHYIMNTDGNATTTRVPDTNGTEIADVVIEGKEGASYTTEEAKNINEKYELVAEKLPANATGTIEKYNEEKPQEVIYYYRLKPAKVLINYLEKDSNEVLATQERIDGHVDDQYNTDTEHRKETIEKDGKTYTLVSDSGNKTGNMTLQDITVTYYYLQNTKATVRYVERDPETGDIVKDLEEPTVKEGLVGDEFVTNSKDFLGYKLVESPEKTTINLSKEEQTLIYYYEAVYTGLIENHIDDKTGKILETETHEIQVGQDYNIPSKEFEGYDLVEDKLPENAEGTMGEELVTVNYYYIKKAVLEVNYLDVLTNEALTEQVVDKTKHEGDEYTTEQKTFDNYDLVEVPSNAIGTMKVETDEEGNITNNKTTVTYYYAKKSAGVEEHHIDILTGKDIEEPTMHEGHVGDEYDIQAKEFLSYKLVEADEEGNSKLPTNATGTMTEEKIVVNYYYNQPAKVIVHYVEKATGKELEETNPETGELQNSQVLIEGFNQDEYETTAKEFEYYTLIERPEEQGKMKVEIVKDEEGNDEVNNTIELYYYYEAKPFNIGVEKEITGIIVNGERRTPTNGKIEKVEIYRKAAEDTSVQVEYKIKVSNTGEVSGNATIEENIPEGMSLANNDGTWEEQEGKLIKVIPEIGAGETKEYTVLLNWEQTGENMGEKANEVKLVETGNVPGFVDNNDKDNTSNANVIISVETGELPIGLILALVALVGLETVTLRYAVVLTKRQKKK